ncbi:beta-1,3-glucanase family protein [Chitinophaga rhizophila]|uniref:Carbohydrate-binding protein n=1 Tax=Chitinophaga rhizophila TaxID=2866212 RepID=A0ABS7GKR3_9BACT|nr:beta-1,3-glucanase family protein [Chitinophaga rhizophila]MBW8688316.1 carbohydrate-binding protein [Chitinophaga rhizophila]
MKIRPFFSLVRACCAHLVLVLAMALPVSNHVMAQAPVPFTLYNNSAYADANVYVGIVGIVNDNYVWINPKTGAVNLMSPSNNTVPGPVINGNMGPGGNGLYANCFARLSEIPNKTVSIPGIKGCRILISFNSQLFLYFFGASGAPSGYAAPNLANPTDPNQGIRYEIIEVANAPNGLWSNTTRVDGYHYPMGLEVWGNGGFYQKVGEILPHNQILSLWQANAPAAFAACYDATNGIIKCPSKTTAFLSGAQSAYYNAYVDAIWARYQNNNLVFNSGDAGTWSGRVSGNVFTFTRASDGKVGVIARKPTNIEVLEGSGALATGEALDKVVQAQLCAAMNRHAIDLNLPAGATQDVGTPSKYYKLSPYNWYSSFWHRTDITYQGKSYGFCYDDVFDQSSTINASSAIRATVTIGGFAGVGQTGPVTVYKDCNYTGTAVNLTTGNYTLGQLNTLGILNDDISSLKVAAGYKVTLYQNDNFTGTSLTVTADDACLVDNGWNDLATSLKVEGNTTTGNIIQAENYNFMSGVDVEATTDAGGGQNVGWIDAGDWMSYEVTIPSTGLYRIDYRVATPNANMVLRLEKDAGATQLGAVTLPNTGGWQNWGNAAHTVTLPAGTYNLGLATTTGGFNLNYFTITAAAGARAQTQAYKPVPEDNAVTLTPNPVSEQLYIRGNEKVKVLGIYSLGGQEVIKVKNPGNTLSVSSLTPGVYIVTIERKDGTISKTKILKQ